ncbi:MAG: HAD-IIIA family hydrolase [Verrucomicrobia bacterium]|nr:HAD-IIIA family hydrolase [Verrucomicrobiota bacterium]MBU4292160.1 HAD-IIIA family hydrolase [Verrucomicrobiota bacterium]MBU4429434.1 HAD-IIIA family hydrolase [Verrucomicrobiota bacterium]MCG2681605.1 HAD-IIIA family hydrolase [Kiritimatiellia bacterium]
MNHGLLIFDLDGTLMDTRRDLCAGVNLMRGYYGLPPLTVDTVAGYIGNGVRNLVSCALQDHPASRECSRLCENAPGFAGPLRRGKSPGRVAGADPVDLDEAVRINYRFYREHLHDETTLYPGVEEGLRQLHAHGYNLALISNKGKEACIELLKYFKLTDLFFSVLGGDSVCELKPHPEAIFTTIEAAHADPAQTWMIGDHVTDLESARRAGVRSVFVSYGIGKPGGEQPTQIFPAFPDLTRFFLTGGKRNGIQTFSRKGAKFAKGNTP